jgi:hypothetical protein
MTTSLRELNILGNYKFINILSAAGHMAAALLIPILLAALLAPARAAQINYGSHMGTNVTFVNVTEDSGADEPLPLFGAPTVTGNSMDFNPTGFDSSSTDADSDITDSNLVFMVTAKSGSRIESLTLTEAGDTTQSGNVPPGSMGTASAVFASGVLDIHEVDFVGINHISVPFAFTFSPSGGTYFLGTDGGGGPIFNTQWNGSVTLDIEAILVANGFTDFFGATKVSIDMDNTLTTISQQGTSASIAKKDFGAIVRTVVPEPATWALAALGAAVSILRRHRSTSNLQ